jgi:hypothetical protein
VGRSCHRRQLLAGGGRGVRQLPSTVRIDIPSMSPGRAAVKVWEELINVLRKDGADPAAVFVHYKKVQHAAGASTTTSGGLPRGQCLDDDQQRRRPAAV